MCVCVCACVRALTFAHTLKLVRTDSEAHTHRHTHTRPQPLSISKQLCTYHYNLLLVNERSCRGVTGCQSVSVWRQHNRLAQYVYNRRRRLTCVKRGNHSVNIYLTKTTLSVTNQSTNKYNTSRAACLLILLFL